MSANPSQVPARDDSRSIASGARTAYSATTSHLLSPNSLRSDSLPDGSSGDLSPSPSISSRFLSRPSSRDFHSTSRSGTPDTARILHFRSARAASPYFGNAGDGFSSAPPSSPLGKYGVGRSSQAPSRLSRTTLNLDFRTPYLDFRSSPPFLLQNRPLITHEPLSGVPISQVTDISSPVAEFSEITLPPLPRQQTLHRNGRSKVPPSRAGGSRAGRSRGRSASTSKKSTSSRTRPTWTPRGAHVSPRPPSQSDLFPNSPDSSQFTWWSSESLPLRPLNPQPRVHAERTTPELLGQPGYSGFGYDIRTTSERTRVEEIDGDSSDNLNEVIMALDMNKDDRIGCAYYVASEETLFIEEDAPMGGLEVVSTLIMRVQPTTIMIPNRASQDLVLLLERNAGGVSDTGGSYILRHLSSAEFDYDEAKESLVRVDLGSVLPDPVQIYTPGDEAVDCLGSSFHNRLMRIGEFINLNSHTSIGCAGAVLGDLNRRRSVQDSAFDSETNPSFQIKQLKMNTPINTLLISADALASLQIVRSEMHPSYQTSNPSESGTKQVLSLFGLLQGLSCTAEGKARLRQMMFLPTTHIALIDERQRTIAILLHPDHKQTVDDIRNLLKKVKNVKTPLLHVRKMIDRIRGQLSIRVGSYKTLLQFSMVCAQLKEVLLPLSHGSGPEIFSRIYNSIDTQSLLSIGERILRTFDFQLSKEHGRTEILKGASEELDRLRETYTEIYDALPRIKAAVVSSAPEWASKYIRDCLMYPGHGFLITVTLNEETGEGIYRGESLPDDHWEMIFASEGLAYYKNEMMRQMDEGFGDPATDVANEEVNVVCALSRAILREEPTVTKTSKLFGELDSLMALALAAEKYGWVKPQMTCSNIIDISDGRHPLQELLVPSYIPNDCFLTGGPGESDAMEEDHVDSVPAGTRPEGEDPSVLILTGPNNSGKSIYMKQVALIVYLAHIGSYVPASRATIGITDRILTRIATRETMMADESAFCIDLKQAAFAINFATRRSLILTDEFGKGTAWHTGAGLLAAFVAHFIGRQEYRPKMLVGTHFHELYDYGVIPPGNGIAYGHLDVRLDDDAEELEDQITYLYKLKLGPGGSSLGILCAELMGVEGDILEQAEYFLELLNLGIDLVEAMRERTEEEQEEEDMLHRAEGVYQRFLSLEIPKPDASQEELDKVQDMLRWCLRPEEGESDHDDDDDAEVEED